MIHPTVQQWLDALRSGKYQQGKNFLRNGGNQFCCLGVLCDITDPSKWTDSACAGDREDAMTIDAGGVYGWGKDGETQILPIEIRHDNGVGLNSEGQDLLAQWNDAGMPFTKIADVIEQCTDKNGFIDEDKLLDWEFTEANTGK